MNFGAYKKQMQQSMVMKPSLYESERVPRQFSDYMNEQNTRFSEICKLYLEGMNLDDVHYMHPEDLINLVPPEHYKHKLLMTIMVRRYIFKDQEEECKNRKLSSREDVYKNDKEIKIECECTACCCSNSDTMKS